MLRKLIDGEYLELDDWIGRATKGLCAEAAERVREEIESHYAESVASLMEHGAQPGAAELEAIKRLGSPYKARRGYLAAYPTVGEMQQFKRSFAQMEAVGQLGYKLHWRELWFVGCAVFLAGVWLIEGHAQVHWFLLASAFAVLSQACAGRITNWTSDQTNARLRYEIYRRAERWITFVIIAIVSAMFLAKGWVAALAPFLLFMIALIYRDRRIWRKVKPFVDGS